MRRAPQSPRRLVLIALSILLVAAITACGGSDGSDEDGVRAAISGYFDGLVAGNGEEACEHVSTEGRIELAELAAISGIDAVGCATIVEEIGGGIGADDADRLANIEVVRVEIDGNRAKARIKGATVEPVLIRSDGVWLIDSGFAP